MSYALATHRTMAGSPTSLTVERVSSGTYTFDIEFERTGGPTADCSDQQTVTYTHNVSTSTTLPAAPFKLVNQPQGTTNSCQYSVRFNLNDAGDAGLVRTTSMLGTVTARTRASATYRANTPSLAAAVRRLAVRERQALSPMSRQRALLRRLDLS